MGVTLFPGNARPSLPRRRRRTVDDMDTRDDVRDFLTTRRERRSLSGVSHSVLESLARALHLDEAERAHLFDLADTANSSEKAAAGRPSRRSASRGGGFNLARFLFLDARSQDFYCDWETVAADCVAALRTEAGRNPYDRSLTD